MAYELPKLDYEYDALEPHMSKAQLELHHSVHHQGYVNKANAILEKLKKARESGADVDQKATLKALSFNIGGHVLHSLFWKNLAPNAGGDPSGPLAEAIKKEFGSVERFKKEFSDAAATVEGSGWAALSYDSLAGRLVIMQVEKHNTNVHPSYPLLLVIDVWEHAYYIDHKNKRGAFIEAFWNLVNWDEVAKRLEKCKANA